MLRKFFLVVSTAIMVMVSPMVHAEPRATSWIYFDLGEVIVTGNPTDGYTYVPGAIDFLASLRAAGYKLALISNIPESWGAECKVKFQKLKEFLGQHLHESQAFEWTMFDAVIVPPFDRYRKPHQFMFLTALANACPGRSLYVGEVAQEVTVAKSLGLATYHAPTSPGQDPLPTQATLTQLLQTDFRFNQPRACDFKPIIRASLLPQDQARGVGACIVYPTAGEAD